MVAARSRVVKLRTVLATLGEDDEASTTINAALQKAEAQAQERPVVEQIQSTQLFIARKEKRVEQVRQAVVQARDALDKAVAIQQEQEALLADGVQAVDALQEKERTIPSPFTIPEPVVSESVIDGLQNGVGKFAQWSTRAGHKRRRRQRYDGFPSQEIEDGADKSISHYRGCRHAIDIQRNRGSESIQIIGQCEFERMRSSRYGLRGVRVGEARNPGPKFLRRPTVVDSDSDVVRSATRRVGCTSHRVGFGQ